MKYLLDTCVLSDFVKGNENTIKQITNHAPFELAISVTTIMEVEYGVLLINGKKAVAIKKVMANLIKTINIIPFCKDTALQAASIRADLHKRGKLIGYYDILIAATAAYHNLTMVTANVGEFERISQLNIQNWRDN